MHYILQNVDSSGLVIIDELGRGTSVDEGMGFCFAFAERLLATNAFTFLATHFVPVTNLQALYPNVEKYVQCSVCECRVHVYRCVHVHAVYYSILV